MSPNTFFKIWKNPSQYLVLRLYIALFSLSFNQEQVAIK